MRRRIVKSLVLFLCVAALAACGEKKKDTSYKAAPKKQDSGDDDDDDDDTSSSKKKRPPEKEVTSADSTSASPSEGSAAGNGSTSTAPEAPATPAPEPPAPAPTPAVEDKLATGCYRIGGGGYFSNGSGQSCGIVPAPFIGGRCGVNDFNALPARNDHGGNQLQGGCVIPQGCYRIGGGGYFSNGEGHSCALTPAKMPRICGFGVERFNDLPALDVHYANQVDGGCG